MRRQYDAFGNLQQGAANQGYAYTGREWDPETGLHYYRARYYDPMIGRLISADPIRFAGGFNFYVYVANAPTAFVDPSGLRLFVTQRVKSAQYNVPLTCTGSAGATCYLPWLRKGPCEARGCGFGFDANVAIDIWQEFMESREVAQAPGRSLDQPWLSLQEHEDGHLADYMMLFVDATLNALVQTEDFASMAECEAARSTCIARIDEALKQLASISSMLRGDAPMGPPPPWR